MGRIVGIDLGTTTSEIAYIKNGKPEIIKNGYASITPSVVGMDRNYNVLVGQAAKNQLVSAQDRTIAEVKRKMGTGESVVMAGKKFTPIEISSIILKELKRVGEEFLQEPITGAVITVPANFNDAQRQATREAGEKAGFTVERILNEPTAAALAYGIEHMAAEGKILVYDIGGGTFDVTVLEMIEGSLDVMASRGINKLGGKDFDEAIAEEIVNRLKKEYRLDIDRDLGTIDRLRVLGRIKEEAEKVKIALSRTYEVTVELPYLAQKDGEIINFEMQFTRNRYEERIAGFVQQTMETVQEALRAAKVSPSEIDRVLAVGGSSRTPLIQDTLRKIFGDKICGGVNPDEAVALGAAVQAGIKANELLPQDSITIFDVCNHTLGIDIVRETGKGMERGFFSRMILRDTHLPFTNSDVFVPVEDDQTEMFIEIYQGESDKVCENIRIGELSLSEIPADAAGVQKVEITFRYNMDGILEVSAKVLSTGNQVSVKINMYGYDAPKTESEEKLDDIFKETWTKVGDVQTTVRLYQNRRDVLSAAEKQKADEWMRQLKQAVMDADEARIEKIDGDLTELLFDF